MTTDLIQYAAILATLVLLLVHMITDRNERRYPKIFLETITKLCSVMDIITKRIGGKDG